MSFEIFELVCNEILSLAGKDKCVEKLKKSEICKKNFIIIRTKYTNSYSHIAILG